MCFYGEFFFCSAVYRKSSRRIERWCSQSKNDGAYFSDEIRPVTFPHQCDDAPTDTLSEAAADVVPGERCALIDPLAADCTAVAGSPALTLPALELAVPAASLAAEVAFESGLSGRIARCRFRLRVRLARGLLHCMRIGRGDRAVQAALRVEAAPNRPPKPPPRPPPKPPPKGPAYTGEAIANTAATVIADTACLVFIVSLLCDRGHPPSLPSPVIRRRRGASSVTNSLRSVHADETKAICQILARRTEMDGPLGERVERLERGLPLGCRYRPGKQHRYGRRGK